MSATSLLQPIDLVTISLVRRAARDGTARRVRLLAGVSLEELGRSSGVEAQTVLRWESGSRTPRTRAAERYAAAITALVTTLRETEDPGIRSLAIELGIFPQNTEAAFDDAAPADPQRSIQVTADGP